MMSFFKSALPRSKGVNKRSWFRFRLLLAVSAFSLLGSHLARAADIWDGGGADVNWNTLNNWDNNTLPLNTADVTFGTAFTSGTVIDLNGLRTVNSLIITSTTAFSLNDNTLTLTNGDITRSAASGTTTINSGITMAGAGNWDITGTLLVNGSVSDTGGSQSLTKNGPGTLILTSNTNNWNGSTTINNGTLTISGGGKLGGGAATPVTINTGGTLLLDSTASDVIANGNPINLAGGTLQLGDNLKTSVEALSTLDLTLSGTSTIDYGTLGGGHFLKFADSSGTAWDPGATLNILNWTSGTDRLSFTTSGGLTSTQMGQINLYSDGGSTYLGSGYLDSNGDFEPTPVPEPSAVLVGLSLLSLAGYRERRWIFRCREARRRMTS